MRRNTRLGFVRLISAHYRFNGRRLEVVCKRGASVSAVSSASTLGSKERSVKWEQLSLGTGLTIDLPRGDFLKHASWLKLFQRWRQHQLAFLTRRCIFRASQFFFFYFNLRRCFYPRALWAPTSRSRRRRADLETSNMCKCAIDVTGFARGGKRSWGSCIKCQRIRGVSPVWNRQHAAGAEPRNDLYHIANAVKRPQLYRRRCRKQLDWVRAWERRRVPVKRLWSGR